ncbi:PAS domain-containing sensor histidine kinase [Actinosynnema sp. NPDC020468]|uniref:sensor histidine kinase n=1 Tax=Actinosynnema sp. NPDC020468 TaxID=3154488 RepID=UPI0033F2A731
MPENDPWDVAGAVRAVTRAGRVGHGASAAVGVLRALPVVRTAEVVTHAPPWTGDVVVPLEAGGAVVVTAAPDPRLTAFVEAVAAAVDAAAFPISGIALRDAIIAEMPTIVCLFGPDGLLRWSNLTRWPDGTPLRYGESRMDAVAALVHPEDQTELAALMADLHTDDPGGAVRYTARVRNESGGWAVMDVIFLDRVDDPVINGLVAFARDVTDLHDAEYHLRATATRLKTLVNALEVGVVLQDADRRLLLVNQAAVGLLGLAGEPGELTGLTSPELIARRVRPAEDYVELDALAARCLADGVPVHGAEVQFGDLVVEVDFVPMRLEELRLGQMWVLRDVTDQVELEKALLRRNEELSRLSALKTEFVATVSHELRTPLTALTSLTPMLVSGRDGDGRLVAEAVERNVLRMATLVETLLFLAGVESHSLELAVADADVDGLVRSQVGRLDEHASALSVGLTVDAPTPGTVLRGDPSLLTRMVHHVVSAAIGTSPPSGRVSVRSCATRTSWTVEVTDDVPLTVEAGRLFTTVPRGHRSPDPLVGSGLGLALARAIAERHGGAVYLNPSPHGGTTVRVELPLPGLP